MQNQNNLNKHIVSQKKYISIKKKYENIDDIYPQQKKFT